MCTIHVMYTPHVWWKEYVCGLHVVAYRHHVHHESCHCELFRQPEEDVYASYIGIDIKANTPYAQ